MSFTPGFSRSRCWRGGWRFCRGRRHIESGEEESGLWPRNSARWGPCFPRSCTRDTGHSCSRSCGQRRGAGICVGCRWICEVFLPEERLNAVSLTGFRHLISRHSGFVSSGARRFSKQAPCFQRAKRFSYLPLSLACVVHLIWHEEESSANAKNRHSRNPEWNGDPARGQNGPDAREPIRPLVGRACPSRNGEPSDTRLLPGDLPGVAGMRKALRIF